MVVTVLYFLEDVIREWWKQARGDEDDPPW